jgi:hypothetical protein
VDDLRPVLLFFFLHPILVLYLSSYPIMSVLISHVPASRCLWNLLERIATYLILLAVAAVAVPPTDTVWAQTPRAESPERSGIDYRERTEWRPRRSEDLRMRAKWPMGPFQSKLETTPANLFTRAGAGLEGVYLGSSSLGDVNGDGNLDLVITGRDANSRNSNPTATLYLGDGQGGFTETNAGLTGVGEFGGTSSSLGDVDGDGNTDLVITGEDANDAPTATLYLGDGQGGFTDANAGLTGVEDGTSSLGDVDGDGNTDLVITGRDANSDPTATLYLGDGQGGFTKANAGLTGVDSGSSSLGDVNGDGNLDLVITGQFAGFIPTATLYLGDGQGGFTETNAGLVGVRRGSSSLGDVNGDGDLDLVITGGDANIDNTATLYLGDGQGGFTKANAGLTGVDLGSSSLGDIDADGDLDLVLTGLDALSGVSTFLKASTRIYVNRTIQVPPNQPPVFASVPAPFTTAPGQPARRFVEVGDCDGDRLSLALTQGGAVDGVSFTDAGNGVAELSFSPSVNQAGQSFALTIEASDGNGGAGTTSFSVQVGDDFAGVGAGLTGFDNSSSSLGDVNGDGNLDLVITGQFAGFIPTATVYLGDGQGGFTDANAGLTGVGDINVSSSSLGDVDGDGNIDLVITGADTNFDPTATLYLGDGQGGFTETNAGLVGVRRGSSSLGDIDADGDLDLVITGDNTATLYLGDGQGGFTKSNAGLTGVDLGSSSLGDVNGDGDLDLVITGDARGPTATVYLGDDQGGFTDANAGLTGVGRFDGSSSSLGDINGDGDLDLVITGRDANDAPTATLYLGDGQGGFTDANAGLAGVASGSSSLGDVNGDGDLDLVITGRGANDAPTATLYLGDGQGGFTDANAGLTGVSFGTSSSLGDLDNDGNLDLLVTGRSGIGDVTTTVYENLASQDFRVAAASQAVRGDGAATFAGTGTSIDFSGTIGSGTVTVQRFENRPRLPLGIAEANVSPDRFVVSAAGDLAFDNSTELRLDVSTLVGISDPSNVTAYTRVVRGDGLFEVVPTTYDTGTGELVALVGTFSEFVLASDTEPLPVELASFEGLAAENDVRLTWRTASEQNNAGFNIQRQHEGVTWTTIGFVESKATGGTTSEPQSYRFRDTDLPYAADALTYRLRQVDVDGTESLSEEVVVQRGVSDLELLGTYPNPARSQATVRFAVPNGTDDARLVLYDLLGRAVRRVEVTGTERQTMTLGTDGLASGMYFLRLTGGGQTVTRKLTVVR